MSRSKFKMVAKKWQVAAPYDQARGITKALFAQGEAPDGTVAANYGVMVSGRTRWGRQFRPAWSRAVAYEKTSQQLAIQKQAEKDAKRKRKK